MNQIRKYYGTVVVNDLPFKKALEVVMPSFL